MFRFALLRQTVAALCMALMVGGIISVVEGERQGWVPQEFAFHAHLYAQECSDDGGGGDQGDRPECRRGSYNGSVGGGDQGNGSSCGFWCWVRRAGTVLGILCRFVKCTPM